MNKVLEKLIVRASRNGVKVPVMELINSNPGQAALIAKLRTDANQPPIYDNKGNKQVANPDPYFLRNISEATALSSNDSENILKLLPDMDLTVQILVSSIISPSDMMKNEILYLPPSNIVNSTLSSTLIEVVKEYFKTTYDLNAKLPEILKEIVAISGSYPICVLPENSLDDLINNRRHVSVESLSVYTSKNYFKPLGFLALKERSVTPNASNLTGIAIEALKVTNPQYSVNETDYYLDVDVFKKEEDNKLLTITDNFNVLKVPLVNEVIRKKYVATALESAMGDNVANRNINDHDLVANIYRSNAGGYKEVEVIKSSSELTRRSIGNPLIMRLPSESVIPIHVPGNPEKHIGYYIVIDELGYPISKLTSPGYRDQIKNRSNAGNSSFSQAMTTKVSTYMEGNDIDNGSYFQSRNQTIFQNKAYTEIIEAQLLAKIKNGVGAGGAELANNEEIYRIMLARSLSGKRTQILFVPIEFMSYFALKYNDRGIGQSYTDFNRTLLSMRVMLMFSNLMCSINNSIARRTANIKFDEKDPDPEKTIENVMGELVRGRQNALPLTLNTPADIVDWINRASIDFTFEGHPKFPDLKIEMTEKNSNLAKPDAELETELKKRSQMGFNVPPENVDASWGPEFARSITNQNILTAKRILQIQQVFTPQLTDFMRKVATHSEELMGKLTNIINENINHVQLNENTISKITDELKPLISRRVAEDFINGLRAKLPEPTTTTTDSNFESVDGFGKLLDAAIDAHFPEEAMKSELIGNSAANIGVWKACLKSYFMRMWLSQNAILPEMGALITGSGDQNSENVKNIWSEMVAHNKTLVGFMLKAEAESAKFKTEADKVVAQINPEQTAGPGSDYSTGTETGEEGGGLSSGGETGELGLDESMPIPNEEPESTGETPPDGGETPEENTTGSESATENPEDGKENTDEEKNK